VFLLYPGLFEDKVGNVWCALDMLLKLRANLQLHQLTRLCLLSTLTFRQLAASLLYTHFCIVLSGREEELCPCIVW
jgi:hypothetical protein